jgi:hypothetical protein
MLNRHGAIQRKLIVFGSSFGSVAQLASGLWSRGSGKRWLVPLAVFVCVIGIVLAVAASIEALSPFVYSIF